FSSSRSRVPDVMVSGHTVALIGSVWSRSTTGRPTPVSSTTRVLPESGSRSNSASSRAATFGLVLKHARENGWGYTRVLGELKKLGVHTVSRTTVANILREAGLDPGPKRGRLVGRVRHASRRHPVD